MIFFSQNVTNKNMNRALNNINNINELSKEQIEYLRSICPHFCIPCYGGAISESFFVSFIRMVNNFILNGISYTMDTIVNESLVTRARNGLVSKVMAAERSTHLFFIDVDIEFDFLSVIKLLLAEKDVIGGLYPKKSLPIDFVINALPNQNIEEGCLLKVKRIGTGFLCVKKEVISKMFDKFPELHYKDNTGLEEKCKPYTYALFDTILTEDKQYLSEDYTFCDRWRDMGGDVWADLSIVLGHTGHYKFINDMSPLDRIKLNAIKKQQEIQKQKQQETEK